MPDSLGPRPYDPHWEPSNHGLLGTSDAPLDRKPYPTGRLFDGKKRAILFDSANCIGCRQCVEMCKDWNERPRGAPFDLNPSTWLAIEPPVLDGLASIWGRNSCMHCEEPMCAAVCPVEAITKYDEGPVVIDPNVCIGCKYCVYACPWHVISKDDIPGSPTYGASTKCTMCYDRLADGGKEPMCVHICPAGALDFGLVEDMEAKAEARAQQLGGTVYGRDEAGGTQVLHVLTHAPEQHGMPQITHERFPEHHIPVSVEINGLFKLTGGLSGKLRAVTNALTKPWRLKYRYSRFMSTGRK